MTVRPPCLACGRPRIPIPGWPKLHPECRSERWVWPEADMRAWLAAHEQQTPAHPSTTAVDATGDRST